MGKHLKIGEMAKACGVSARALRVYQEAGILQPEEVDPETGYRTYSIGQSVKLDLVAQLQSAGFTLHEIADIETRKDVPYLLSQAERRSRAIERQMAQLAAEKRVSDEIAQGCRSYLGRALCATVLVEKIPERAIIVLDPPTWEDLGGTDDYTDNERWELYQQYTKRKLADMGLPRSLFRRVSCYVPVEDARPDVNLQLSRPFVFVDDSFGADVLQRATVLPECTALTAYYDNCHTPEGKDLDKGRLGALFSYAEEHGLVPCGPLPMENIFRYMRLFNRTRTRTSGTACPFGPARSEATPARRRSAAR